MWRQVKIYQIVGLVLATVVLALLFGWPLGIALVFGASLITAHLVWARNSHRARMRDLLRGVQPSHERVGQEYSLASQARTQSAVVMWSVEIASLVFVGGGVGILVTNPGQWLPALAAIGFFGLCAAVTTYMLVLRWRGASARS
jgi:hypothetical protein